MATQGQVSVISRGGRDYWRTWFIQECEETCLFGFAEKHLRLLKTDYQQGKKVYLEDAPYFHNCKIHHRLCGPYELVAIKELPQGAEAAISSAVGVVVYRQSNPQAGPWFDRRGVRRSADGLSMKFDQLASEYEYFPLRIRIKRAAKFDIRRIAHEPGCWLCK